MNRNNGTDLVFAVDEESISQNEISTGPLSVGGGIAGFCGVVALANGTNRAVTHLINKAVDKYNGTEKEQTKQLEDLPAGVQPVVQYTPVPKKDK